VGGSWFQGLVWGFEQLQGAFYVGQWPIRIDGGAVLREEGVLLSTSPALLPPLK